MRPIHMLERLEPRCLLSGLAIVLQGDVTHDGYVDAADAQAIARMVVRLDPANMLGDLSGDGTLSGYDASLASALGKGLPVVNRQGQPLMATIYNGQQLTVDGVLHVFAPDPSDMGAYWTVAPSTAALWGNGPSGLPSMTDIQQGVLADCYLLAALGGLTLTHPTDLMARITLDGTGFAVEFASPHVVVHVDARFSAALQVDHGLPLWPDVVEKAEAWYRTYAVSGNPANTFVSIAWGDAAVPYRQFGWNCSGIAADGWSEKKYADYLAMVLVPGQTVLLHTGADAPDLIPSHVYVVLSVDTGAGTALTWNPWGFEQTVTVATLMANDINWLEVGQ